MQEEIRNMAGLQLREASVEDLVLSEGSDGEQLEVTGVCLGEVE